MYQNARAEAPSTRVAPRLGVREAGSSARIPRTPNGLATGPRDCQQGQPRVQDPARILVTGPVDGSADAGCSLISRTPPAAPFCDTPADDTPAATARLGAVRSAAGPNRSLSLGLCWPRRRPRCRAAGAVAWARSPRIVSDAVRLRAADELVHRIRADGFAAHARRELLASHGDLEGHQVLTRARTPRPPGSPVGCGRWSPRRRVGAARPPRAHRLLVGRASRAPAAPAPAPRAARARA